MDPRLVVGIGTDEILNATSKPKPKKKKAAKRKAKSKAKKKVVKKLAKRKAGSARKTVVRTERLDMRLSKDDKRRLNAKAKKTGLTITEVVLKAVASVR